MNETWPANSIDSGEVNVLGYKILGQDRTKSNNAKNKTSGGGGQDRTKSNKAKNKTSGGGVALCIDADINYKPRPDLNNPNLELVWRLKLIY